MKVLLLLLVIGVVVFAIRQHKKHDIPRGPRNAVANKNEPTMRSVVPCELGQPDRFDEETAEQPTESLSLSGAAWIVDGDTIKVENTQIRLFGVDAPEMNHPHGKNAKWALHRLCKGQIIRADITDRDEYNRVVARCYLPDGRDLSAEMVKMGLAIDWPKFSGGEYGPLESEGLRRKLFLADARQKGRMDVWYSFEARNSKKAVADQ